MAEYQDLAGNALVNSEAESEGDIAPTGASLLNIRILQRRLGEEIRQEAAMYLTLMEEVIVKGDVSLEGLLSLLT